MKVSSDYFTWNCILHNNSENSSVSIFAKIGLIVRVIARTSVYPHVSLISPCVHPTSAFQLPNLTHTQLGQRGHSTHTNPGTKGDRFVNSS